MLRKLSAILLVSLAISVAGTADAAFVLNALSGFGGSDGWLSPAESSSLGGGTSSFQRGIAYNGVTNQVILADRNGGTFLRVLDGNTGALVNNLNTTGIAGGTLIINMVDVGDDGFIYAGNLSGSAAADFSIYRWADSSPATEPTIAFRGPTGYARTGDSFAVTGAGADTRIIASGSGSSGIAVYDTFDGESFTQAPASPTTGSPAGGFRLGLDFIDGDTTIGKQTGATFYSAVIDFDGTTIGSTVATEIGPTALQNPNENLLAFYGPNSLLATLETNSNLVRLYDASKLSSLTLLSSLNLTSAFLTNGNAVGDLAFGVGPGGLRLYALNTNNGIQAFSVTAVPEPGSILLATLFGVGVVARRRFVAKRKTVAE